MTDIDHPPDSYGGDGTGRGRFGRENGDGYSHGSGCYGDGYGYGAGGGGDGYGGYDSYGGDGGGPDYARADGGPDGALPRYYPRTGSIQDDGGEK